MTNELKSKMQELYDSLINSANTAFKNSEQNISPEFKNNLEGKAEAYEYSALILSQTLATEGIFLQTKETNRNQSISSDKIGMCTDTELDITEIFYTQAAV